MIPGEGIQGGGRLLASIGGAGNRAYSIGISEQFRSLCQVSRDNGKSEEVDVFNMLSTYLGGYS